MSSLESGIYVGEVRHRRTGAPAHGFTYKVAMTYLDLDETESVCANHPLWSPRRRAPVQFRRADYIGAESCSVADAVRDTVERAMGVRPLGPVRMLAHLRTWGWLFNPITCYYCFDQTGRSVEWLVVEVTNTPWHERHAYVVGPPGEHCFDKELHVSPFMAMDQRYRLTYSAPVEQLTVRLELLESGHRSLDSVVDLRRRPVSRRSLATVLWRYPLMTMRISAGIYLQALRLAAKGARVHSHPSRTGAAAQVGGRCTQH